LNQAYAFSATSPAARGFAKSFPAKNSSITPLFAFVKLALAATTSIWNHRAFPKEHWKKIRTTNGLERINKELKRRSRVVGAFPNDGALLRLGVTILMDINEEWLTGRKYLSMIEEWIGVDTRLEIYRKLGTLPTPKDSVKRIDASIIPINM
jgi:hypothetical protein